MRPPRTSLTPAAAHGARRPPRPLTPSAALAAVVGAEPLTRSEIVTRVWAYIRAHDLQAPADRRVILPDERLRAVFGRERVDMPAMVGLLTPHLRAL